ncbi:hypothetical protein C4573_02325 [Candidatus Woesearchaeota archaeon]|nr:MAG: hypothetical protein C4573_02325 [Candidatus Woesearchaeota archaeon]
MDLDTLIPKVIGATAVLVLAGTVGYSMYNSVQTWNAYDAFYKEIAPVAEMVQHTTTLEGKNAQWHFTDNIHGFADHIFTLEVQESNGKKEYVDSARPYGQLDTLKVYSPSSVYNYTKGPVFDSAQVAYARFLDELKNQNSSETKL